MSEFKSAFPGAIWCPMCGFKCISVAGFERHLVSIEGLTRADAFRVAELIRLDVGEARKAAFRKESEQTAIAWDITASQAAGRDVRRKTV